MSLANHIVDAHTKLLQYIVAIYRYIDSLYCSFRACTSCMPLVLHDRCIQLVLHDSIPVSRSAVADHVAK